MVLVWSEDIFPSILALVCVGLPIQPHRIHGTGIFTYIYHQKTTIHVGKNIPVPWIRNGNRSTIYRAFEYPTSDHPPSKMDKLLLSKLDWNLPPKEQRIHEIAAYVGLGFCSLMHGSPKYNWDKMFPFCLDQQDYNRFSVFFAWAIWRTCSPWVFFSDHKKPTKLGNRVKRVTEVEIWWRFPILHKRHVFTAPKGQCFFFSNYHGNLRYPPPRPPPPRNKALIRPF